mmetsp:Transcript_36378/g.97167  ORF Transcript_36378/g.97167 Transcript_36378/m.97167 type:complete len:432 (+) Transcript_36378:234-1529(+)
MSVNVDLHHGDEHSGQVKNHKAYEKLMKQLEHESEELEHNTTAGLTTAEIIKRRRAKEEKSAEEFRRQAKAAVDAQEAKEKREKEEAEKRAKAKADEEDRQRREAEEEAIRELERKTKKFFTVDRKYNRKSPTGVMYFGEYEQEGNAWVPHGYGEFRVNGEVIYDGEIYRGKMHGTGMIKFENDDTWKGKFHLDEPNGIGLYKFADGSAPRERIYRNSRPVCWVDELIPGVRIRLLGPQHNRNPMATIIEDAIAPSGDLEQARFKVKCDLGGFLRLYLRAEKFTIIKDQPMIAMLEKYIPCHRTDAHDGSIGPEPRYNYEADQANRSKTDYHENFYHDVKKVKKIQKRKQDMTDEERTKSQNARMRALMAANAKEKQVKAEMEAALAEEKARREQEAAEAAAYEAEVAAQREALAAKRAAQERAMHGDPGD